MRLVLMAALAAVMMPVAAVESVVVGFTPTDPTPAGNRWPKHIVAVWTETSGGVFVKTLGTWTGTAYRTSLSQWTLKNGGTTTDASMGATINQAVASQTSPWLMGSKGSPSTPVADGDYRIWIETADNDPTTAGTGNGTNVIRLSMPFAKDGVARVVPVTDPAGKYQVVSYTYTGRLPSIANPALNITAGAGTTFTATSNAAASPSGYQWRRGTVAISGAIASTYTISSSVVGDAGSYDCILTYPNAYGLGASPTMTSNALTLTVTAPVLVPVTSVALAPTSTIVNPGTGVALALTPSPANCTSPSYAWYRNTANTTAGASLLTGEIAVSLSAPTASAGSLYYFGVVSAGGGTATSAIALVTVRPAPVISAEPVSATVAAGGAVSFSVTAGSPGFTPLTYRWQSSTGGVWSDVASGGTGTTLTPSPLVHGTGYRCVVINANGAGVAATSAVAALAVVDAPTIASDIAPLDPTLVSGAAASFTVSASIPADPPGLLAYRWQQRASSGGIFADMPGETAASVTVPVPTDGQQVRCVLTNTVSGAVATSISGVSTMTVISAVPVTGATGAPAVTTVNPGGTVVVSLTTSPAGITAPAYAWYASPVDTASGGTLIAGATGASYTAPTASAGTVYYYAVVTAAGATATTAATAQVTVRPAPVFSLQPVSATVPAGASVSFPVAAASPGFTPLTYRWESSTGGAWDIVPGGTGATLVPANPVHGTRYRCVVTNANGAGVSAISAEARLTIVPAPTILTDTTPLNPSVVIGSPAIFTVTASIPADPPGALSYQWQQRIAATAGAFADIPGANAAGLNVPSPGDGQQFRCVLSDTVSGVAATVASRITTVTLTAAAIPVVAATAAPAASIVNPDEPLTLTLSATPAGITNPVYAWYRTGGAAAAGGTQVAGQSGDTLPIDTTVPGTAWYYATVTAGGATATTASAVQVTVRSAPVLTGTVDVVVPVGTAASFAVSTPAVFMPLTYQWQSQPAGGAWNDEPGGTGAGLTVGSPVDGTRYRCVVVNAGGAGVAATSAVALLTVVPVPVILADTTPLDPSLVAGDELTLALSATIPASPAGTLGWRWQRRATSGAAFGDVPGATAATLATTAAVDGEQYRCLLSNTVAGVSATTVSRITTPAVAPAVPVTAASLAPAVSEVAPGTTVALTVTATPAGITGASWIWYRTPVAATGGGTVVVGAAGPTWQPPTDVFGERWYYAVVSAAGATATTAQPALVRVGARPTVNTEPHSVTVAAGDPATFAVAVDDGGYPALAYQWQARPLGGVWAPLTGATAAGLTVAAPVHGTDYRCIATNAGGTGLAATSAVASVTVVPLPALLADTSPVDPMVGVGDPVAFSVEASIPTVPAGALAYQWQAAPPFSGSFSDLPGETSAVLVFTASLADSGRSYRCRIINAIDGVQAAITSAARTVTVSEIPGYAPAFLSEPTSATVAVGNTATFLATVDGDPAPGLVWSMSTDGVAFTPIAGATEATFITAAATAADVGTVRWYRLVATNLHGSATSATVELRTTPPLGGGAYISFTSSPSGGGYAPRHVLAVWIQRGSTFITTVADWSAERRSSLVLWNSVNSGIDAVVGATRMSHRPVSDLHWTFDPASTPDGTYTLWVESADDNPAEIGAPGTGSTTGANRGHIDFTISGGAVVTASGDSGGFTGIRITAIADGTGGDPEAPPVDDGKVGSCGSGSIFACIGLLVLGLGLRRSRRSP